MTLAEFGLNNMEGGWVGESPGKLSSLESSKTGQPQSAATELGDVSVLLKNACAAQNFFNILCKRTIAGSLGATWGIHERSFWGSVLTSLLQIPSNSDCGENL